MVSSATKPKNGLNPQLSPDNRQCLPQAIAAPDASPGAPARRMAISRWGIAPYRLILRLTAET